jgi:hypothetical protein
MTEYAIYLDAAGHPSDQDHLTLAGFLASESQWISFGNAWADCLDRHKVEPPFHANKFFFDRRNDANFSDILRDLVETISNHVRTAFSATIDLIPYRKANERYRFEEIVGTPYAMMTRTLIFNFEQWRKIVHCGDRTVFFVEDGTLHQGDMQECLRDRDRLPIPQPVPKSLPACQAADLYAYVIFQYAKTGVISDALQMIHKRLPHPQRRYDGHTGKKEIKLYLNEPRAIVHNDQYPEGVKVRIPLREGTKGLDFNFKGRPNQKRIRRMK